MADRQGLLQRAAAKVQIAVLSADILTAVAFVLDGERRSHGLVQYVDASDLDFNLAGRHLEVLALAFDHFSDGLDDIFTAEGGGGGDQLRVGVCLDYELGDAIAVAKVDECHSSEFPRPLHPSCEGDFLADVSDAEFSASVSSVHMVFLEYSDSLQI